MLASRPLGPLGRRDLERRVLQDRLQMLPVPQENRARERRVLPDLVQMALTEAREPQDPLANKESEDQIKRLPWPLRLRALLPLSSLLSLRHLRRLLLRRLRRQLRLLLSKLVELLDRRELLGGRESKETLAPTAQMARPETLVRVAALAQQVMQALRVRVVPLARREWRVP